DPGWDVQLVRGRLPSLPSDRTDAQGGVADQVDDVHRHPPGELGEVLLDGGPAPGERGTAVEARVQLDERVEVTRVVEGRIRAPVDPDDLGGHPLADLRLVVGLGEEDEPGVRVHVDEAGANPTATRVHP